MSPEVIDLLKSWGPGLFWIVLILIWAIKEIVINRQKGTKNETNKS